MTISPVILTLVSILIHSTLQSQNEDDYHTHPCNRECLDDSEPKECKYDFTIEYYYTLTQACYDCPYNITDCLRPHCVSADGVSRAIMTVNRKLPGPSIHVCKGDTVVVNVKNMLEGGEGVSLHWHGVLQEGTPHMDGVTMITQCPIHTHTTFQYRFKANDPGTHFWHAHSGQQRTDGMFGSFVIRRPRSHDASSMFYDEDLPEHTIMLNDWLDQMGAEAFAAGHHAMKDHFPSSILINGRGTVKEFNEMTDHSSHGSHHKDTTLPEDMIMDTLTTTRTMEMTHADHMFDHMMHKRSSEHAEMQSIHNMHNMDTGAHSMSDLDARHTPHALFKVKQGKRYRFRIISNGIANCPIQFSIDHHSLTMISTDGSPFNPILVESFTIFAGERYDFVLTANQHNRNYWIRARGLAECGPEYKSVSQTAFLTYEDAAIVLPPESPDYQSGNRLGLMLNPLNIGPSRGFITVDQLDSLVPDDDVLKPVPDKKFYIAMDFNMVENPYFQNSKYYSLNTMMNRHGHGKHSMHMLSPQLNHISFMVPPSPPLTQHSTIVDDFFCNEETMSDKDCTTEFCQCTHRIKVQLGEVIELVLVDEGKLQNNNHPMHLHGHSFRVVAMEKLNTSTTVEFVKVLDAMGQIKRKLTRAVLKDTVTVPDGGYTIIRFKATNPGFWLFHCHIAFHMAMGMTLVIQVGETHQMPKPPKSFPKCGDWTPESVDDEVVEEFKSCPQLPTSVATSTTTVATTTKALTTLPSENQYLGGLSQTRDVEGSSVTLHYVLLLWMTGKKSNNTTPALNTPKPNRLNNYGHFPIQVSNGAKKFLPKPAYNIHALRNIPDIPIHLAGRARTTLQELLQYAKPLDMRKPLRTRGRSLKRLRHKTILGKKLSNILKKQQLRRLHR
ncbi:Hypothetical predicted protein [Mytilus galloprovincialis]|uniref:Uncharacterized protein n=1 Tax=Mytilus galloprovincialis TaxID=29158 RepID=A0A8B6C8Z7_MYTGA|nr:Hypothetical predicted protein [Mytilus galloprovincialis]